MKREKKGVDVAGLKTSADQVKLVDMSSSQMTCDGTKELITKKKRGGGGGLIGLIAWRY